ncbi:SagB family peptide dehydrogenase [Roseiflexus sp.]|uniref:SagB family peptide dehydrogenase n=1 Tax=Roseiflexus sp. TaxID=2562120 RepID=UPI00398AC3C0
MKRLRHDVSVAVSIMLLIAATAAILTGIIADLWHLTGFVYHTYAGYIMAVLAIAHVALNWSRMARYVRFRLMRSAAPRPPTHTRAAVRPSTISPRPPANRSTTGMLHALHTRRGFLGALAGLLAGAAIGRSTVRARPDVPFGTDLGVAYHQWSKPGISDLFGAVASWGTQPPLYKTYPDAPRIVLPPPDDRPGITLEEAVQKRRSVRAYSDEPLTLAELSRVLFFTGGINTERFGAKLRAAPSAGALYPIETYLAVHRVTGIQPGVYHYTVADHTLALLREANVRSETVRQGLMQSFLGTCGVVVYFTVILQRLRWRYQERSYRYALLEAGHLAQNLYLAATSLGMGVCAVGAFLDDEVNAMLGVDGEQEAAVYMLSVGKT